MRHSKQMLFIFVGRNVWMRQTFAIYGGRISKQLNFISGDFVEIFSVFDPIISIQQDRSNNNVRSDLV